MIAPTVATAPSSECCPKAEVVILHVESSIPVLHLLHIHANIRLILPCRDSVEGVRIGDEDDA